MLAKLGLTDFTAALRIIHAAEYCLGGYVLTLIFRDMCSRKWLLAGLITFLLFPSVIYSLAVMPEIELLLLSTLVAYALIVKFPQQHYRGAIFAGVLLALALLVKSHAIAIVSSAFAMVVLVSLFGLPRGKPGLRVVSGC